jgi:hypothetical protein
MDYVDKYFDSNQEADFLKAKIYLVVRYDDFIKNVTYVMNVSEVKTSLNEIFTNMTPSNQKIGNVEIYFDLFLSTLDNKYVWITIDLKNSGNTVQSSHTVKLLATELVEHYNICQNAYKRPTIPIFNGSEFSTEIESMNNKFKTLYKSLVQFLAIIF